MNKHIAPVLASVAMLGVVGGVAAAHAFQPAAKPAQRQVQFVAPAAETVTPTATATVTPTPAAPAPVVTPTPVKSVVKKAPAPVAPRTVQRQASVSEPVNPAPAPVEPTPDPGVVIHQPNPALPPPPDNSQNPPTAKP